VKLYVGNITEKFDCDTLLKSLENHDVDPGDGHMILPQDNPFYQECESQNKNLKDAGYTDQVVEYRHYKPKIHFDNLYVDMFADFVNIHPLMCWISEIRPGKCTPWHWDINPNEYEHKKLGNLVRFFCFLSKPAPGHIFVTKDDCYYNEAQGSIYQYSHIHEWHAGSNVGLIPKFLLTFTGYQ
jgi:hypothetical protein